MRLKDFRMALSEIAHLPWSVGNGLTPVIRTFGRNINCPLSSLAECRGIANEKGRAWNSGDSARAGRLLGFSQDDIILIVNAADNFLPTKKTGRVRQIMEEVLLHQGKGTR